MAFIVELWDSIFTPGTTPALMKATHASFILLLLSLSWLIYVTRSIHYINLLIIALLLYGSVLWFVKELEQAKLKSNEELQKETAQNENVETLEKSEGDGAEATSRQSNPARKRKV